VRADISTTLRITAAPPTRPALPERPRQLTSPDADASTAAIFAQSAEPTRPGANAVREARRLNLASFAVAATALLMPFTALVALALATVGHAKGDQAPGRAAFLASLAAMAVGFLLNLTVIDVAF
jgi:hypothetical protein